MPAVRSVRHGKVLPECGTEEAGSQADGWVCASGAVNKGKFCAECGAKKARRSSTVQVRQVRWEPADPTHPPKFCPECGDPFDDGDIQG